MKTALTIAGSDSCGGAGVQADLKTFAAFGVYGASAITAVTAQNTAGVSAVHILPADIVLAQIESVAGDLSVHAVKTGMLATAAIVEAVAAAIDALDLPHVVVDPVMVATSGDRLLSSDAVDVMRTELLPRASVVTPNKMEAEVLAGCSIDSAATAREAAVRIHALGPGAVIVTGGHFEGMEVIDLLYDGREWVEIRGPRIASPNTHGSGCTYAAAVAANLALGHPLAEAARQSQRFVAEAIKRGIRIGRHHGTLDQFWRVY